jgi:hypothetical protein
MGRKETPIDPAAGSLAEFAARLRALRRAAGSPTYRRLARKAHYSASTLSIAARGQMVPSLAVTLAYVRACDGDAEEWTRRWHELVETLTGKDAGEKADLEGASSRWPGVRDCDNGIVDMEPKAPGAPAASSTRLTHGTRETRPEAALVGAGGMTKAAPAAGPRSATETGLRVWPHAFEPPIG